MPPYCNMYWDSLIGGRIQLEEAILAPSTFVKKEIVSSTAEDNEQPIVNDQVVEVKYEVCFVSSV